MRTKRRWTLRTRSSAGEVAMLVIEVPQGRGCVYASLGDRAIEMEPETVSRLVEMYRQAQRVALQDRGTW
jgi:hypothetical protein